MNVVDYLVGDIMKKESCKRFIFFIINLVTFDKSGNMLY